MYATSHLRVHDILVEHDARKDATVLDLAAGDLLHAGVPLDVDRAYAAAAAADRVVALRDGADGLEREAAHQVRPAYDELGPDRGLDERQHLRVVARVDRDRDAGDDLERGLERFVVGRDDDDRMDIPFELREGLREDLAR